MERTTIPEPDPKDLGPLADLVGTWEGNQGIAISLHAEIGYCLWGPADQQVNGCFSAPHSTMVLAGGTSSGDVTGLKTSAERGSPTYGFLESIYFPQNASTAPYEVAINVDDENSWPITRPPVLTHPLTKKAFLIQPEYPAQR